MKLKKGFITHETGGEQILVAAGRNQFAGFVRSNATAAFVVECLKKETTPEEILDAMCEKYEAPREQIQEDLGKVLDILRSVGALEE